jgi:succinyl-diaminopimelate desuccinylase
MAEQAAPPTPADAEIVERISKAILAIYGKKARVAGVGGGTVAAGVRRKGLHAVVWATLSHQAHQPNEWASIAATIGDAKVMAHALMAGKS